ncbi:hypothetical protein ACFLU5_14035, partial [Bacteroidota bacterium]
MKRHINFILAIILSVLFVGCGETDTANIYISPEGKDSNPGTLKRPLLSLETAIQRSIEKLDNDRINGLNIIAREGIYPCSSTITLDNRISRDGKVKIVIRSFHNERAIISGGMKLSGWHEINILIVVLK